MLYVVTGPPAAGKTTWVTTHAQPGDIVLDYDALANTITAGGHTHTDEYSPDTRAVTKAARQAAIDVAITITTVDVYLIHSTPSRRLLDRYLALGADIITIDPGRDTVMRRIKTERPHTMLAVAARWYEQQANPTTPSDAAPPAKPKRSTTEKGLGWTHQQERDALLRAHRDGDICWWCGLPMYKTQQLHADHSVTRAEHRRRGLPGRPKADRLLHGLNQDGIRCNQSRGDGSRDHLRPAITHHAASSPHSPGNSLTWH